LYWHPAVNPAGNLSGAGLGRIPEKWPDSGFAEARAEIWYDPSYYMRLTVSLLVFYGMLQIANWTSTNVASKVSLLCLALKAAIYWMQPVVYAWCFHRSCTVSHASQW